jgi:putative endonuclease
MNATQSRLIRRVHEKYKVDRLIYFETYSNSKVAAQREQQIKKWRREKKIALFAESNAHWEDINPEIHQAIGVPPLRKLRVGISEKA